MRINCLRFLLIFFACLSLTGYADPLDTDYINSATPHFVQVPGGKLEYYSIGQGSPLVLIAGYGSNVTSWDAQMLAKLAAYHQVIVFDNRDTGGSVFHTKNYTSVALANDTYALITALHLHKPTIVGISMGGMIAQQYAVLHPDAIAKLVLINTAIAGHKFILPAQNVQQAMQFIPNSQLGIYARSLKLFSPPGWRMQMVLAFAHERFHPTHYTETKTTHAVLLQQQALIRDWTHDEVAEAALAHLNVPTLILNGARDEVIPPANSDVLHASIAHSTLLRYSEGGHMMTFQYPCGIASTINQFVK